MHPKFIAAYSKNFVGRTSLPAVVIGTEDGAYIGIADGLIRIHVTETSVEVNERLEAFSSWEETAVRLQSAIHIADKHNPYRSSEGDQSV